MLNFDLLKTILVVAMASSIVSTALIQKTKENISNKKVLKISSLILSLLVGTGFALSFSDLEFKNAMWVGIITYVGADAIYKTFEDKIFKSFGSMNKTISIPTKNKIVFKGVKDE